MTAIGGAFMVIEGVPAADAGERDGRAPSEARMTSIMAATGSAGDHARAGPYDGHVPKWTAGLMIRETRSASRGPA